MLFVGVLRLSFYFFKEMAWFLRIGNKETSSEAIKTQAGLLGSAHRWGPRKVAFGSLCDA